MTCLRTHVYLSSGVDFILELRHGITADILSTVNSSNERVKMLKLDDSSGFLLFHISHVP